MKNILKSSPILTILKDDVYLHRRIEKKHFKKRGFFSSKKALFVGNIFDKIIFLNKYNRFKKIKPLKQNKYLTVIKNNDILDLSTYSSELEEKEQVVKNSNFIQNKIAEKRKFFVLNDKVENRVYLKRFIKEEKSDSVRAQRNLKSFIFNSSFRDKKLVEKNTFNSEEKLSPQKEALVLNNKKIKPENNREESKLLLENRTLNVVDEYLKKNKDIKEKEQVVKNSNFIQNKIAEKRKFFVLNDKVENKVYLKRFIKEEKSDSVRPQRNLKSFIFNSSFRDKKLVEKNIFNSEEELSAKKEALVLNNKKIKPENNREESKLLLENRTLNVVDEYLKKNKDIEEKEQVVKNSYFIQNKIAEKRKFFVLNDKVENKVYLKRFIKEEKSDSVRPQRNLKSFIFNSSFRDKKLVEKNTFNSEEKLSPQKEALVLNNKKIKPENNREESKLLLENRTLNVVDEYLKKNKDIKEKEQVVKNSNFIQNKIAEKRKFFVLNDKVENKVYLKRFIKEEKSDSVRPQRNLKSFIFNSSFRDKKLVDKNIFNSEEELSAKKEALVLNNKKIKPENNREESKLLLENRTLNVVDEYLKKNKDIEEKEQVVKNSYFIQNKIAEKRKFFVLNDKVENRVYLKRFIKEEKSDSVRPQRNLKSFIFNSSFRDKKLVEKNIFNSEEELSAKKEALVLNNKKIKPENNREESKLLLENRTLNVVDEYLKKNKDIEEKEQVVKNSNFIQNKIAEKRKFFVLNNKVENRVYLKRFIKEEKSDSIRPQKNLKSFVFNSSFRDKKLVDKNIFNSEEELSAKKEALVLNNKKIKPENNREESKLLLENRTLNVVDEYLKKNKDIEEKEQVVKNSYFIQNKIAEKRKFFVLNDKVENRVYLKRFIKEEKSDSVRPQRNLKSFVFNSSFRDKKLVDKNIFNSEEELSAKKEALVLNNKKIKPENNREESKLLLENRTLNVVDEYLKKNKDIEEKEQVVKNSYFIQNKIAEKRKFFVLNDKVENRVYLKRFIKEEKSDSVRPQKNLKSFVFNSSFRDKKLVDKNIFNSEEKLSTKKEALVLTKKKTKASKKKEDFDGIAGFNQKNLIKKDNRKINSMGKHYDFASMLSLANMTEEKFYMNTSAYGLNEKKQEDKFYLDFVTRMNGLNRQINHLENSVVKNIVIKNGMTLNESTSSFNNDLAMELPLIQKEELTGVKYAKSDRHQNVKSKKVESASLGKKQEKNENTDDLNELSMKIFRRLKNDIKLEYARLGR